MGVCVCSLLFVSVLKTHTFLFFNKFLLFVQIVFTLKTY